MRTPGLRPGVRRVEQDQEERAEPGRVPIASRLIDAGLRLAVSAGLLALAIPFFWAVDPSSDSRVRAIAGFGVLLCEVFAFHGGLALGALALGAVVCRRWRSAVFLAVLGGVHAGPGLVACVLPPRAVAIDDGTPTLTILSHNLLFSSASLEAFESVVDRERPDAIMLQEVVGEQAREILERFGDDYPHIVWPNTHRWGGMALSRMPFIETPDPIPGEEAWPIDQPVGVIEFEGGPVTLVGIHLPAPNSLGQLVAGPRMTARLADWIEARPGTSMVLAGDFNAPLWTTRMTSLRDAGLAEAHRAAGGGRGSTWPSHHAALRFIPGIRLDQAAFTGDLRCIESRVLGPTGSDHRPILARFARPG